MRKVLVTGWSGFIGRALIQRIRTEMPDCEIWNFGRTEVPGTTFVPFDQPSFDSLPEFDWIVHTLALSSDRYCEDFERADEMNVSLTKRFIRLAESKERTNLLYLSSVVLYDNATTPPVSESDALSYFYNNYSFTKGVAEEYVRYRMSTGKLRGTVLRLANVFGPGQRHTPDTPFLIPEKIVQAITEKRVVVRNSKTKRDWLYVDDAVDAFLAVMRANISGKVFNLGSGRGCSAGEIAEHIAQRMGAEYLSLELPATGPQNFYADISNISSATGWAPKTSLQDGLDRTIEHIVNEYAAA